MKPKRCNQRNYFNDILTIMNNYDPIFGNSIEEDDALMTGVIDDLLAQGIQPKEIGPRLDAMFPGAIVESGAQLLKALRRAAGQSLPENPNRSTHSWESEWAPNYRRFS